MPEAWPSIRSTARWVFPVLVGPRTAMSREASPRAGERFMPVNVANGRARRKSRRSPCRSRSEAPTLAPMTVAAFGGKRAMFYGQVEGTDFVVLDKRFEPLFAGYARVERLWTGARWSEGPAWF